MPRLTPLAALVPTLMALSSGAVMAADTGDAPADYGVATHTVVDGAPFLGRLAPDDNEPVAGAAADGDGEDEDGVFAFPELVQNGKAFSTNVFASNPGTAPANLVGWVDFDGNGRFDADESATLVVPPGSANEKFKLVWNDLTDVSTEFSGDTYARFRITGDEITGADATGDASDGEVEDYTLVILDDIDGDETPDGRDLDNDNDGIPDEVEVIGVDTDGDGKPDYLDSDSDGDLVPDFVEAGPVPSTPRDTDDDGIPDYLDLDSDNDGTLDETRVAGDTDGDTLTDAVEGTGDADGDGVPNTDDIDSDNDLIPDVIEVGADPSSPVDSDGDGVPDFLDLDSDNDGVPDLFETTGPALDVAPFDTDRDGRADRDRAGGLNGFDDGAETSVDSGVPRYVITDTDGDGIRDYLDLDSDNDGVPDVIEAGLSDVDSNGLVDSMVDANGDGFSDAAAAFFADAVDGLPDTDDDGVRDLRDADAVGGDGSGTGGSDPGGSGVVPVDRPTSSQARVETGLSGYAGCSIGDASGTARDPLLPALALTTLLIGGLRRRVARVRAR